MKTKLIFKHLRKRLHLSLYKTLKNSGQLIVDRVPPRYWNKTPY